MRHDSGMNAIRAAALCLACFLALAACATPPPPDDAEALAEFRATNDPIEPANRAVFAVNDALDTAVIRPAAQAYRFVVPEPAREGVHNVLMNVGSPVRLANDILQAKPRRAGDTLMRFAINSTVGVLGIFDVAKNWGYPEHDSDFGITLALWGMPEAPYLMLPVLGPSDVRDTGGLAVDYGLNPFSWVGQGAAVTALEWSYIPMLGLDSRARRFNDIDAVKKTSLDPYATFRSLYRQVRAREIEDTRQDHRATIPVWFPQPG